MASTAQSRPYHHGQLERAAIDGAIEEVESVGVAAVSMRRIARRAGVSHSALAYQFGDKAGIFTAVATEGFALQAEVIGAAATGPGGFLSGGQAYVTFALTHHCGTTVVMSYGMGVDSTAILLRWLTDPSSRDFDLRDLVVISADTGGEFEQTITDVQEVVLPALRAAGVRFIQVGRSRRKTTAHGGGVAVLQDSTEPTRLYAAAYTLEDEMLSAGTLPQIGGVRTCSIHAKGNCLDPIIAAVTAGRRYRHVVGFESEERSRALKDALFNTDRRTGWYPLQDWGWDRARCSDFIAALTGRRWAKSACGYCPFAMRTDVGRQNVAARWRREPQKGARALFLEHVARSLNERQTLIEGSSAANLVTSAGLGDVQARFGAMLDECEYAVYEVRRLTRRSSAQTHGRGITARSVRAVVRGTRQQMRDELARCGGTRVIGGDGIVRHFLRERGEQLPALEHFFVVCPAVVEDKERPGFRTWWQEATSHDVLF